MADENPTDPFEGDDELDLELGLDTPIAEGWTLGDALAEDEAADARVPGAFRQRKAPNPSLALVLVGTVTLVALAGLVLPLIPQLLGYADVVSMPPELLQALQTISTLGVGSLAAATGIRNGD